MPGSQNDQSDPTRPIPVVPATPAVPPGQTPRGGATAPDPKGRRRGLIIMLVMATVVVLLGIGACAWVVGSRNVVEHSNGSVAIPGDAFTSAMRKAGVTSPAPPTQPVELASVKPSTATHTFDAVFTPLELTALLNAFSHPVTVGQTQVSISDAALASAGEGALKLSARVQAGSTSYRGTASGPVAYQEGHVLAEKPPLEIQAEGLPLPGAQAQQATDLLLAYVNGYIRAAPSLALKSAEVTLDGVHATGVAPDSISW